MSGYDASHKSITVSCCCSTFLFVLCIQTVGTSRCRFVQQINCCCSCAACLRKGTSGYFISFNCALFLRIVSAASELVLSAAREMLACVQHSFVSSCAQQRVSCSHLSSLRSGEDTSYRHWLDVKAQNRQHYPACDTIAALHKHSIEADELSNVA